MNTEEKIYYKITINNDELEEQLDETSIAHTKLFVSGEYYNEDLSYAKEQFFNLCLLLINKKHLTIELKRFTGIKSETILKVNS